MIVLCIFFFYLFFFSSKIFNFTDVCFITYWPTDNSDILRLYRLTVPTNITMSEDASM